MRRLRTCIAGSLALAAALLLASTAVAQSAVVVTPSRLAVAGTRGDVETRTLLLRATTPVTSLRAIPLDVSSESGSAVLPASAIHVALPAGEIEAGGLLTVPVAIDLGGVPSGRFSGELLLDHHGGSIPVPLTVTVKDPWLPALLATVAGVALGGGVSAYRSRGKPRDDVLVRVGQLRAQLRSAGDLAPPFRAQIKAHMVDAEAALQGEKWQDARQAMEQAEAVWLRWRRWRPDWLAQMAYHAELTERLKGEPSARYVHAVQRGLDDALRDAPGLERPGDLRERLDALALQANRFARLRARLDTLNDLRIRLPGTQAEEWRIRAAGFKRRLQDLSPDEDNHALEEEIEEAISDLEVLLSRAEGPEMITKADRGLTGTTAALLAPAPSLGPAAAEREVKGAHIRVTLFTWASYAIAVALLAGAGFGELYVAKAAFGANAWGDYFALFAWGFGAEATRAAVGQVVRNWGLPGIA
jgi:hypothetical protein